jgi:hypothetical protein
LKMSRAESDTVTLVLALQYVLCFGTIAASSAGCNVVAEPEAFSRVAQADSMGVPGYVHELSRSRLRIGQGTTIETSVPIYRWRGTLGAFAKDPSNGFVFASIDATTAHGEYILDESSHASRVRSYFVSAGLPADQIGELQATYTAAPVIGPTDMSTPPPAQLESINTILRRRISGVLVVESEAWAKMTTSGDVDMEYVFWPPISAAIVAQAVAFARSVGDPANHSDFLRQLPGTVANEVGVVIHHTDVSIHATPTAFVSFDAVMDSGARQGARPSARHFDSGGKEFRLPQEMPPAPSSISRSKP